MSIDPQYAIKKDVRNNPVVRDSDVRQKREFVRAAFLATVVVLTFVLLMLPYTDNLMTGYRIEELRQQLERERSANRILRLNLEAKRAPKEIERRARPLGLRPPAPGEVVVIEVVPESTMPNAVVARADER
jgi:hypothetical protein